MRTRPGAVYVPTFQGTKQAVATGTARKPRAVMSTPWTIGVQNSKRGVKSLTAQETATEDEERRSRWTKNWSERMTARYGPVVYERGQDEVMGRVYTWGQALCRQWHGTDFEAKMKELGETIPTWKMINMARGWDCGMLPPWIDEDRMKAMMTVKVLADKLVNQIVEIVKAPDPKPQKDQSKYCLEFVKNQTVRCKDFSDCWSGGQLKADNKCGLHPGDIVKK